MSADEQYLFALVSVEDGEEENLSLHLYDPQTLDLVEEIELELDFGRIVVPWPANGAGANGS